MVAGDEAPERVAADEGQGHGAADAHVGEVLDVQGGDAAEVGVAQVEGLAGAGIALGDEG